MLATRTFTPLASCTFSHQRNQCAGLRFLLCLFFALVLPLSQLTWAAESPLIIQQDNQDSVSLTSYFAVLEDPANKLMLSDVMQPEWAAKFTSGHPPAASLIYGFTRSAYWLRLRIQNPYDYPIERLLDINYARLADVQLHKLTPGAEPQHWLTGTNMPFVTRPYANRGFVFPITLAPHMEHTLYLKVKAVAALEIPATLWEPKAFHVYERADYVGYSVYSGMALAMVIFNLLVFALLREVMYLLYVFFVTCFAVTLAAQNGLANEFLWPNSPTISNYSLAVGYSMTLATLLLFTRRMLNTNQMVPRIDKLMKLLVGFFFLSPVGFVLAYQKVIPIATLMNVFASSLILFVGIYCAWKRQRSAYIFVAAFLVICTASPINSARVAGLLPTNMFTVNGLQIGSAIEMILLAYALADRFNMTRREKEQAQQAALNAQQLLVDNLLTSERLLEEQVKQRTEELLEKNRALEQLSITDQLTGIYNRLKLHQILTSEIERSKRYQKPLSLLLLDVDHFKAINDNHGHPAGDSVLRDIASLLKQHSRTSDSVGRWGGEEFVIVCPETHLEGAAQLAESLKETVGKHSFNIERSVTASIGITSLREDDTLESLMERVDRALYQAKENGRDCVVANYIDLPLPY
jgi:two-component system, sensor histidine kinase LadS